MHILLILALAVLFPATHILSGWLFDFATLNDHISLIYLPAFLRLFNLLILGPLFGTLSTVLGCLLLLQQFNEPIELELLNVAWLKRWAFDRTHWVQDLLEQASESHVAARLGRTHPDLLCQQFSHPSRRLGAHGSI